MEIILRGLRPYDIFTESVLTQRFCVSKMPIREALTGLSRDSAASSWKPLLFR